jgi:DNA-binding transcriptional ArsR family regulator
LHKGRRIVPTPQALKILKLLAKEWDHIGPPGILDISNVVAALDLAPSETLQTLKELYQSGLVDMNQLKTAAFLTPEGYEAAETS